MKNIVIELRGCDDSTYFDLKLTDDEVNLVKEISKKSKEVSTYHCMPVFIIEEDFIFKTVIEDCVEYHGTVEDTINEVKCNTHFKVDSEALKIELYNMKQDEAIRLRDNCVIYRL